MACLQTPSRAFTPCSLLEDQPEYLEGLLSPILKHTSRELTRGSEAEGDLQLQWIQLQYTVQKLRVMTHEVVGSILIKQQRIAYVGEI